MDSNLSLIVVTSILSFFKVCIISRVSKFIIKKVLIKTHQFLPAHSINSENTSLYD